MKEQHFIAWGKIFGPEEFTVCNRSSSSGSSIDEVDDVYVEVMNEGVLEGVEHSQYVQRQQGKDASDQKNQENDLSEQDRGKRNEIESGLISGCEVVMGGAESFGAQGLMYVVYVVDLGTIPLREGEGDKGQGGVDDTGKE